MDAPLCLPTTSGRISAAAPASGPAPAAAGLAPGAGANRLLVATPRRVRRAARARGEAQVVCSFGAAGAWGDTGSSMTSLSHLASLTGFALGALFVGRELAMEQDSEQEGREVCESCKGTGTVPCICQRWSDDDAGCGTCGNSGMMACQDCGGGGTKVAVARMVPIYAKNEDRYRGNGPYGAHGKQRLDA